jgi:hypothetical protein
MSVQPGQYNIPDVQRRADYDLLLQFKSSNASAGMTLAKFGG